MENIQNEEMEIDLWKFSGALKKRALVILAAALLCACLACAYTLALVTPNVYFFISHAGAEQRRGYSIHRGSPGGISAYK